MKIICTLEEYARIIRTCQRNMVLNECKGCVMENICNNSLIEDVVQFEAEDADQLEIEYVTVERRE